MSDNLVNNKYFVFPCLQERKVTPNETFSRMFSKIGVYINQPNKKEEEQEIFKKILPQIPSNIDNNNRFTTMNVDQIMNKFKSVDVNKQPVYPTNDIRKAANYAYIKDTQVKKSCGEVLTESYWKNIANFILPIIEEEEKNEKKTFNFIFVSHHHRMKQGVKKCSGIVGCPHPILPLINQEDPSTKKKYGYANTFCYKVTYNSPNEQNPTFSYKIEAEGFPDKTGPKDEYTYVKKEQTYLIDDSQITEQLNLIFSNPNSPINKKINIFIIRHGNALHNKPTKFLQLDSSLTPLGIFQAQQLGEILKKECQQDFLNPNSYTTLACSFLNRTQLTGLKILESIFGEEYLPDPIKQDLQKLEQVSVSRYEKVINEKMMNPIKLLDYAPLISSPELQEKFMSNFPALFKERSILSGEIIPKIKANPGPQLVFSPSTNSYFFNLEMPSGSTYMGGALIKNKKKSRKTLNLTKESRKIKKSSKNKKISNKKNLIYPKL